MTLFGLKLVDLAMIAGYFAVVTTIGFWSARWVKTETDFFSTVRQLARNCQVFSVTSCAGSFT
jgi:Na+/proline symporter